MNARRPSNSPKEPFTEAEVRQWLRYEPDTGKFFWVRSPNKRKPVGSDAGSFYNLAVSITIGGRRALAHRLAWLLTYGKWPSAVIDHINGNPADNRIVNLRDVSQSVNMQNVRRAKRNTRSGVLGVQVSDSPRRRNKPYYVQLVADGKRRYFGSFATVEEAHAAYVSAKRKSTKGTRYERNFKG